MTDVLHDAALEWLTRARHIAAGVQDRRNVRVRVTVEQMID